MYSHKSDACTLEHGTCHDEGVRELVFPPTVSRDPPTSLRFLWWTLGRSLWWLLKPSLLVLDMSTDVCMFLGAKGEGGREGGRYM